MQIKILIRNIFVVSKGACGPVDTALDSRSEGLEFDSQCWPCVEVLGKLCIPHCLGPPSCNGYLVHRSKVGSIVAGCIGAHLARGKVKGLLNMSCNGVWALKQLPLPLLYNQSHKVFIVSMCLPHFHSLYIEVTKFVGFFVLFFIVHINKRVSYMALKVLTETRCH